MSSKDPVARTRYVCPHSGKAKFLQTRISLHGSKEKAKAFLDDKKRKILAEGKKGGEETKDEGDTQTSVEIVKQDSLDGGENTNLMEMSIESTPEIDEIYNSLKFSPFVLNMDITATGFSLSVVGSSKSGKTYLLKRLLEKYVTNKKSICILCAQNVHNNIYRGYPKDVIMTDAYSSTLVKAGARINKKMDNKFPICYVLDDIITVKNDSQLEDAYLTLRNSLVSIIVLIQNIQLLKSTSRSNSNIIIFKKFNNPKAIEEYVMKEYLGNYPPFRNLKMSDKITLYIKIMNDGHYNFFVLDVLENTLILCKGTDLK